MHLLQCRFEIERIGLRDRAHHVQVDNPFRGRWMVWQSRNPAVGLHRSRTLGRCRAAHQFGQRHRTQAAAHPKKKRTPLVIEPGLSFHCVLLSQCIRVGRIHDRGDNVRECREPRAIERGVRRCHANSRASARAASGSCS